MRKQFKLMKDTNNRTFFKDGLDRQEYYIDDEGDLHCIETLINTYITVMNEKQHEINELTEKLSQIEKIINNRLDDNVIPKWSNNQELFIEEKVGYHYALKQLKKKLIREGLLFTNE